MAEALYRKYRPQVFSEVVGQDHIERTLKNAIEQDKLSHAYLFCGPRGTGKTTTARLLAKALLCENGPTSNPDGTCASCHEIAAGEHPDVYELDAASRTGVENVREEIIGRVQFAPTRGKYKVYIIDEVHMLSVAAFNALLKTLEEPPSHVVFILCTTDPQKVPETILSRCQRFDFRRIDNQGMVDRLAHICEAEGVTYEQEALEVLAGRSDGGLRNALTALEQAIAFGEGAVTLACVQQLGGTQAACDLTTIINALAQRDIAAAFTWVDTFAQTGGDFARLTADLAQRVRDMYFLAMAGTQAPLSVPQEMRAQIIAQAKHFLPDRLSYMLTTLGDVMVQMKQTTNARLCFEIALTKLCHPASDITLESLAQRVEALEQRPVSAVQGGSVAAVTCAAAEVVEPEPARSEVVAAEMLAEEALVPKMKEAAAEEPAASRRNAEVAQPQKSVEPEVVEPETTAPQAVTPEAEQPQNQPAYTEQPQKLEGFSNPAVVQRVWQRAFAEIKRNRPAYTSLLMSAHVAFNEATGSLTIAFRPGYAFALSMLQKPEALDYLQQAVSAAAGAEIPVEVIAEGAQSVPAAATATTANATDIAATASAATTAATVSAATTAASASTAATNASAQVTDTVSEAPVANNASVEPAADAVSQATPGWTPYEQDTSAYCKEAQTASFQAQETSHAPYDYEYEEVPVDVYEQDDPFALPVDDEPTIELNEFQQMLATSFGEGVVVQEE